LNVQYAGYKKEAMFAREREMKNPIMFVWF
jgi:hypothetical protein